MATLKGTPRFADLSQLENREVVSARTRRFDGDGSPFLLVPGLAKVEKVIIGVTEIPLTETRRYLEDATGRETSDIEEPIITLETTPDGRQVLLRSPLSNHGIWQAKPVYVTGEWDDSIIGVVPTPTEEPTGTGDTSPADEHFVNSSEDINSLPDELKQKLLGFNSLEEALSATNEQFNALGIKGLEITRAKAALQRSAKTA